ncbi:MAG: hypothetical protein WCD16_13625 [Paracoccaceae bacterium]
MSTIERVTGGLLLAIMLLVIADTWSGGGGLPGLAAGWLAAALLMLFSARVRWTRVIFVAVGFALAAAAFMFRADWLGSIEVALRRAAFISAFFTALTSLRNAADSSPAIQVCGRFLAQQPPGRRYAALTLGGQLFALLLNYGAIALLGSLAAANARQEQNAEIRAHRIRRMLLAIQRGFVSTLPWSPLAFAMAISTSLVPGATWGKAIVPCLVSGAILAGLGWALDTLFKPRLSTPAPARARPEGSWASLLPLLGLLAVLIASVGSLHLLTGIGAVGVVMVIVPIISTVWVAIQANPGTRLGAVGRRAASYLTEDLPGYRSELVLLMMAGFIGSLGASLLVPVVAASGMNLTLVPAPVVLVALVWIIPITGQLGMNPILSVSLIAPVLPHAAAMGVSPSDIVVAITAGWALSGASSPYTATTLLIGTFGRISALHVGIRWNGVYTLLSAVLLSLWVTVVALV